MAVNAVLYDGDQCPNGGITVETGIDENGNGVLDATEVDETQIVCNGEDGVDGVDGTGGYGGTDGTSFATSITVEPTGSNCANGGTKIEVGLDDNSNGVLDTPDEVDNTGYVCNDSGGIGSSSLQGIITLAGQSDNSGIIISLAGTGFSTTSDSDGNYTLTNIPQGMYDIVFDGPADSGYETGATLYDYRLFADIDDYDLMSADLKLGRGVLLSAESRDHYSSVQISADFTSVVYAEESSDNLYSVAIGGGTPTLLASGVSYHSYVQISADSASVVYTDGDNPSGDLYSVLIGGGTPTLLASDVYSYFVQISADSASVVYTDGDNPSGDLYSVLIGGGTPTLLASNVYSSSVQISADSASVVYTDGSNSSGDLYSVPIGSGTPTLLASNVYSSFVQISADSASVVYTDGSNSSDDYLCSVPISGGTPVVLASDVNSSSVQISADSTSVVYEHSFTAKTKYYRGYSYRLLVAPLP